MSEIETLEVFDFDWTLFRSPFPPYGEPEKSWWASQKSLMPPHVPLRAPRSFWIEEIVKEMKASQRRSESLTVVLTARRGKTEERIIELLNQRGLEPEEFHCRSASFAKDKSSSGFKRATVSKLLRRYPSIVRVVVWEDTQYQIDGIQDLVSKRLRLHFEGNLVTDRSTP